MGFGRFVHLIGSAFLLVATALLVVSCVSAPVIDQLAIFKVDLGSSNSKGSSVVFGSFGYCVRGHGGFCSSKQIGYDPAGLLERVDSTDFGHAARSTAKALTNVMVLHAVAAGFTFVAFLLSIFSGIVGGFLSSIVAVAAFIITAVALVCDFVSWSIVRHDINKDHSSGSKGTYGPAIWCVLAAGVLSLIGAIIVFITCCAGRRKSHNRHSANTQKW